MIKVIFNHSKKRLTGLLLLSFLLTIARLSAQDLKLNYDKPAKVWEEAIPLGNSRLGAMVYGIPHREEIQLNEETIWGGGPYRNDNPEALKEIGRASCRERV